MDDTRNNSDEFERDFSELAQTLDKLTVKYPDESEITSAIDLLRPLVPAKPSAAPRSEAVPGVTKRRVTAAGWRGLMRQASSDVSIFSPLYWILSFVLFVIGFLFTLYADISPYRTMALLAPVPVLAGIMELFKGREHGVLEMELACRYSASQILLSRLLVIVVYNMALNLALTGCVLVFTPAAAPGQLVLAWLTPLAVVTTLSLWLATVLRGAVLFTAGLSVWMAGLLAVVYVPQTTAILARMNAWFCVALIAASLLLGFVRLRKMADKYFLFETEDRYAAGH